MKHKIFLIVGRTASGKDTVTQQVASINQLKQLYSYATRPKRSENEDTHIFISPEEVKLYQNQMVAYTKIGEYEYFATLDQLKENDLYIIDPNGVEFLKRKCQNENNLEIIVIYIYVPESLRFERGIKNRKDDINVFIKRNKNEHQQFLDFEENQKYDYIIKNIDLNQSVKQLTDIILKEKGEI